MPPDVVYVVGPGDGNDELRFSLRSLRNLPHRQVWVAGYCPTWVAGAGHVPVAQSDRDRFANSAANIRAACEHPDVSDPFVLFNDDFYVLRPIVSVPVLHRGPLEITAPAVPRGSYRDGARKALAKLRAAGIEPLSYEVHAPMLIAKGPMLEALAAGCTGHARTVYGNLAGIDGTEVPDPKALDRRAVPPDGAPLLSTSPASWHGAAGRRVQALFPDPSPYERIED